MSRVFNLMCEGDADISAKHEPATQQDSTFGYPQPRAADDCPSTGGKPAADTGRNPSVVTCKQWPVACHWKLPPVHFCADCIKINH